MAKLHSYGLDWLDEDKLFSITESTFKKVFATSRRKPLPLDPFTIVAHGVVSGSGIEHAIAFDEERAINKTLSDNVGYWHQRVLGLSPNWIETGAAGGKIDLRTVPGYKPPDVGCPVVVEIKNRFNTIKGADEKHVWDDLDSIARADRAVAYLFQIVPKTSDCYDRPWKVSGRTPRERVRCCDGVTAYAMVFERPNALFEIYNAFPKIFEDITGVKADISEQKLQDVYFASFPEVPFPCS